MKIVLGAAGMGNMMFQYAFRCAVQKYYGERCAFVVLHRYIDHNGYELRRVFGIDKNTGLRWHERLYVNVFEFLNSRLYVPTKLLLATYKRIEAGVFDYDETVWRQQGEKVCYAGVCQTERMFTPALADCEVRSIFSFNLAGLNRETQNTLGEIEKTLSVSLHVRRGDYLSAEFAATAGNCCDLDYYRRAVEYIQDHCKGDPHFYVFSDDIAWVRENIKLRNAAYIDFNKGVDSWQDMFLMSRCNHNIIANSTFSWWGAYLNAHDDKIVVAPKLWWRGVDTSCVVPSKWVRV